MNTITSYKGKRTYIFISYAHRDKEKVLRVIRQLIAARCRVWYDEGIEYGTEWSDEIADRIYKSDCMIAFISPDYVASKNCISELKYASQTLSKDCLLIYLEDAELPRGIEMYMDAIQAIRREAYETESSLWAKMREVPMILRSQDKEFVQAVHCSDQARVCKKTNRKKEAAKLYRKAIEILCILTKEDGGEDNHNILLLENYSNLAMLFKEMGQKENAEKLYREEKEVCFGLIVENPEKETYKSAYADCCDNLVKIWEEMGQTEKTAEVRWEALQYRQLLAEKNPESPSLAAIYMEQAGLLTEIGKKKEAAEPLQEAIKIYDGLLKEDPENTDYLIGLADGSEKLAKILSGMKQREQAAKLYQSAANVYGDLNKKRGTWGADQAMCYCESAWRLEKSDPKEAKECYERGMKAWRDHAAKNPGKSNEEIARARDCMDFASFLGRTNGEWKTGNEREKLYKEVTGICRRLAEGDPENEDYQYLLGRSYACLGTIYCYKRDQKAEAEKWHRRALDIFNLLTAKNAVRFSEYVAAVSFDLAVCIKDRDPKEAAGLYQKAIAIRRDKAAKDPNNEYNKAFLVLYCAGRSHLLTEMKQKKKAEEALREAIKIFRGLTKKDQGEDYTVLLLANYDNLAMLLNEMGEKEKAENLYREKKKVCLGLITEDPEEELYRSSLADTYIDLAYLLIQMDKKKEAEGLLQEAVRMCRRLLEKDPKNECYQMFLGRSYRGLGRIYDRRNRKEKAAEWRRKALDIFSGLAERDVARYSGYAAAESSNLAKCIKDKDPKEAAGLYRKAIEIRRDLIARDQESEYQRSSLAFLYRRLADLLMQTDQKKEAEGLVQEAVRIYECLLKENPENEDYQKFLGRSCGDLGRVCDRQDRKAEAEKWHRRALDIFNSLAVKDAAGSGEDMAVESFYTAMCIENRNPEEAVGLYQKAIGIYRDLIAKDPKREYDRAMVVFCSLQCARLWIKTDRKKEAEKFLREGLEMSDSVKWTDCAGDVGRWRQKILEFLSAV